MLRKGISDNIANTRATLKNRLRYTTQDAGCRCECVDIVVDIEAVIGVGKDEDNVAMDQSGMHKLNEVVHYLKCPFIGTVTILSTVTSTV